MMNQGLSQYLNWAWSRGGSYWNIPLKGKCRQLPRKHSQHDTQLAILTIMEVKVILTVMEVKVILTVMEVKVILTVMEVKVILTVMEVKVILTVTEVKVIG